MPLNTMAWSINFSMTTIFQRMNSMMWLFSRIRLYDYFRTQARRKRNTEVISIHLGLYSDGVPLEEVLPGQDRLMQEFEMQQMLHDLASHISEQQMKIVRMKGYGYGIKEISSHEKIPMKRIQELLEEVHTVFLRLCRE